MNFGEDNIFSLIENYEDNLYNILESALEKKAKPDVILRITEKSEGDFDVLMCKAVNSLQGDDLVRFAERATEIFVML